MLDTIFRQLAGCESVLDVGTGHGYAVNKLRRHNPKLRIVGIDAHAPSLRVAARRCPDVEFRCMDARHILREFGPQSFEAVVGFDIVEHLSIADAIKLLEQAAIVARKVVWWFVPIGLHPQTYDPRDEGNEELQRHRSVWQPNMLAELGYKTWYYPDWHAKNRNVLRIGKATGAAFCRKILTSFEAGEVIIRNCY